MSEVTGALRSTLSEWWSRVSADAGIQIDASAPLDRISVHTDHSRYDLVVIDPATARVWILGGSYFWEPTPAQVLGSSLGGPCLKAHGVYVGLRMELAHRGGRIVTGRVRAIERTPGPSRN